MHEWIIVIGALLIVGILLDGVRRMRRNHRNALKMDLPVHQDKRGEEGPSYGSELPSGGARIKPRDAGASAEPEAGPPTPETTPDPLFDEPPPVPEQVALNLDEQVPLLMEVEDQREPDLGDSDLNASPESAAAATAQRAKNQTAAQTAVQTTTQAATPPAAKPAAAGATTAPEPPPAEEVVVINVMAASGQRFAGGPLLDAISEQGLRYGAMQIFHRHEQATGSGPVLFSMANIVKPGTFDLDAMETFTTPGVSFFLSLPLPAGQKPMQAFEIMVDAAYALADALDGELKDEQRSVMTKQTIEHCRQRIRDFERRQLSKSPS